jgi:hypothetical protein
MGKRVAIPCAVLPDRRAVSIGRALEGSAPPSPRAIDRRLFLAFAILLSLVWQSVLLQTHSHLPLPSAAQQSLHHHDEGGAGLASGHAPSDDPSNCPICREMAQAGHYLLPAPFAILAVAGSPIVLALPHFLLWPGRHEPHGWYGRGPPEPLQAR